MMQLIMKSVVVNVFVNNGYHTRRSASGMETSEKVGAKTLGLRPP